MPVFRSIFSLILFSMISTLTTIAQPLPTESYYPWKSKAGLFGYSDQNGKLKIAPQFEEANLFVNQFAIVEKSGKKGVIDNTGTWKLNCEYENLVLVPLGTNTIAIASMPFNAWWKFSKWNFFPGFSVMGGTRDKRMVDTKVPKKNWKVILLNNNNQTIINSDHKPTEYPYEQSGISVFYDKILINNKLYRIHNGKVKLVAKAISPLTDTSVLQKKGDSYQVLNKDLQPQDKIMFKAAKQISVEVNGNRYQLQTKTLNGGNHITPGFLRDDQEQVFIDPDLSKPFPKKIGEYFDQQIKADEILKNAMLICAVPNTPYFIIQSFKNNRSDFYLLHKNGTWESDRSKTKDFTLRTNSGNIVYPNAADLGLKSEMPDHFTIKRIEKIQLNKFWVKVSAINQTADVTQVGIYDLATKKWILPLRYSSLEIIESHPELCRFELENESNYKHKKYGIINLLTNKVTVKPLYNSLTTQAKAGIYNGDKWDYFYINPLTGKEYREN